MRRKLGLAAVLLLASAVPLVAQDAPGGTPRIHGPTGDTREAVQWQPADLPLLPGAKPGISSRTIIGSAAEPGIYLIRVHMQPGAVNAAHLHPDARVTTVLSGTVYYGVGTVADRAHAQAFGPGSVYFTPPWTPHFLVTGDESATYEEVGFGPSRSDPVARQP